jgi:hypothetical protein
VVRSQSMCRWWCHRLESWTAIAFNNLVHVGQVFADAIVGGIFRDSPVVWRMWLNPRDFKERETSADDTGAWGDEFEGGSG